MTMGRLEAIWLKRFHGGPMDAVGTATVKERGLLGSADNSATRSVTIIDRDAWDDLMKRLGGNAPPSARRANLMVSGVVLSASRGRVLQVGPVRLLIGGETRPCEQMEAVLAGLQGAMRSNWGGGVYAKVIEGGVIAVGDPVTWYNPVHTSNTSGI